MRLHTKNDFCELMKELLNPLIPLYTKGCAGLKLGDTGAVYPKISAGLEAFSRPLWALVPFWMGGGKGFESIICEGLRNGSDPEHEEYWGGFSDYDQRFVEMAAIACGIIFTPQVIWDPLSTQEKENLAAWLYGINEYIIPVCNWQFFMVLVNVALKKSGYRYSEKRLQEGLNLIEDFYLGEGWYRDGASCQKDYYVSFALHYYGLLYSVAMENEESKRERCAIYRDRAKLFARDFIYWFDDEGGAIPYGRSLTYRFGQGAFWAAYVFAGLEDIPLGEVKGILARHLRWWMDKKIFDRDKILTIGYGYPNLTMAERYNAPGSPYWGMKIFLILALPDSHPFWEAKELPLPKKSGIKPLFKADMLMHTREHDMIAYPGGVCEKYGHGHVPEKYAKFAYSTRFSISVAHSQIVLHENAPDNMLAFVIEGDDYVFVRKASSEYRILPDRVISIWSPFPGIKVKTAIIPSNEGHLRIHEIESDYNCTAYDCGFAVEKFTKKFEFEIKAEEAYACSGKSACKVRGQGAKGYIIEANPNTNLLYPNTVIPAVVYEIEKNKKAVLKTEISTYYFE